MLIVRKVASFVLSVHNFLLGELLHFKFPIFKKKKKMVQYTENICWLD